MIKSQNNRVIPKRETQDFSDFINGLTQGKPFIIKNYKDSRVLDTRNASLDEIANTLATLIKELKDKGIVPNE